jgi:dTDP-4-amino-4,6-dideoxygalactose transaminase
MPMLTPTQVMQWNERRRAVAASLRAGLADVPGLELPEVEDRPDGGAIVHAWHVFYVFVTDTFALTKEEFM